MKEIKHKIAKQRVNKMRYSTFYLITRLYLCLLLLTISMVAIVYGPSLVQKYYSIVSPPSYVGLAVETTIETVKYLFILIVPMLPMIIGVHSTLRRRENDNKKHDRKLQA